jgi:hypothetical protein
VFAYLQQQGGRLPENIVVPMILQPTMSALDYIHQLVRQQYRITVRCLSLTDTGQSRARAPHHIA